MNNLRGAKIIYQESKATQPSHLYFLQKDANYCEAIVTSESGAKRKLNINVDLSNYYTKNETDLLLENYYTKNETFSQTEINNLLNNKQDKLSSYDESILIENDGNIEGNVSLFEEYFEQQECELNFTPIQIIGIYVNGIKQRPSSYVITLPKTITIVNFAFGDYIEIQYTKLKI